MAKKLSPIKIKRPGAFTAKAKAAGESIQQLASDALAPGSKASVLTRKQANFARNAAKWKKDGK